MHRRLTPLFLAFAISLFTLAVPSGAFAAAGDVVTINFNNGNPFTVGPAGVHSAAVNLPATVTRVVLQISDPLGDWADPANAGGTFMFGMEYTPDGGTTWKVLVGNGIGQPVGSWVRGQVGQFPRVGVASDGLTEAYGKPVRAFASSTIPIRVAATATVTQ